MYSVGFLVAYLTVLFIVAEPLRNAGKYTMADVLAYRLSPRPVRAMASLSTLIGLRLLHDRADGRRGRAGVSCCSRKLHFSVRPLLERSSAGRAAHDRLRGLRRHARDDLGADHQGDAAHERHRFSSASW